MNTEIVKKVPTSDSPTFLTVNQFSTKHPFVTPGGLRFQIFNAKQNGLDKAGAVVRLGRRVLLDEEKYFAWIQSHQKVTDNG